MKSPRSTGLLLFLSLFVALLAGPSHAQDAEAPSDAPASDSAKDADSNPEPDAESDAPGDSEGDPGEEEDPLGGEEEFPEEEGDFSDLEARLEEGLTDDVSSRRTGSFGKYLTQYGIDPYLHAYATFDYVNFEKKKVANTFDMHYFNLFIGANIRDRIIPELQIEYEHSEEISVRFAQVDIWIHDLLTIRAGLWLVPFGTYNEYLYPEFLSKTPRGPILDGTLRELIPVAWNDVGVQLRGRYELADDIEINYVAYVANGLEQKDDANTPLVEDGGSIRAMRKNFRDQNSGRKSVGGRVGFKGYGLNFGGSVYHGAYTEDGRQEITFFGFDAQYERGGFSAGVEAVYVHQRKRAAVDLYRKGVYAWVAYRFEGVLGDWVAVDVEPVFAIDWVRLGNKFANNRLEKAGNRRGYIGGINIYPFPQVLPNLNWRVFYAGYDQNGDEVRDNIFMTQLTLGF
ncbi:MAG: hypothetical protein JKY65_26260 [Planctomycetes bacterium]|nr:hypothetical protein [Planctomycetota bacterium]